MAVTSILRDRGRALGVVVVMAMSVALLSAPTAFGADGDPIATSTFKFKIKGAFKKQLKQNGVKMKSKGFKISTKLNSDVDPITGAADLRLGTIVFKKGNKKIVYNNLKGTLPGNVTSSQSGKLFKITKAKVARNGYGANLTGIKVKFLKGAAKKINRALDLNSLKKGNVGSIKLSYQPETVKIIGGTAETTGASNLTPPLPVGAKLLLGHCVSGLGAGITPIAPAEKSLNGTAVTFRFPVVEGEISPDGTQGLSKTAGGLRLLKSENGGDCAANPYGELTQTGITTNITERTVSSTVNVIASPCPALTICGPGDKGNAVGQTVDPTNTVVTIDPANRTFTLSGSIVKLAQSSATVLNSLFPCVENGAVGSALHSCDPNAADTAVLFGNDIFGTSKLTVTTR